MNDIKELTVGSLIELNLRSLARGGKAVGKHESGRVVFVAGGAPQEKIQARVTSVSPRFAEAEVVQVIEASPSRVTPQCPINEKCGGCNWQHIEYREQVQQKSTILLDTLKRMRAVDDAELAVAMPFQASPNQWRYRSRVTLRSEGGQVGYSKRESHDFVAVEDCLIAAEGLIAFAKESIKKGLPKGVKSDRFQVSQYDGKLVIGGSGDGGFSQVNVEQNKFLQKVVRDAVIQHVLSRREIVHWHLLDLYCGNGNITFPVIEGVRAARPEGVIEATGVDGSAQSIGEAARSARAQLCKFEAEPVEKWLGRQKAGAVSLLSKKGLPLDEIIILDPPRMGCENSVMPLLARRKASLFVYVSCDPATQARDLQRFREACAKFKVSYVVEKIQGLDMFPQTDHIESILVLRRKPI